MQKVIGKIKPVQKENELQFSTLAKEYRSIADEIAHFEKRLEDKNYVLDPPPKVNPFKGKECYYPKLVGLYEGTNSTFSVNRKNSTFSL